MKRIAIKIGSNVLTQSNGALDTERMSAIAAQIAALHRSGIEILLISSGAVVSGRNELPLKKQLDTVSSRQLFAAVGQAKLINRYYELFRKYGIVCGQILTTKENFSSRRHYLNQRNCMSVMLDTGVIPIVNENDAVSVTELMFTDNDELAGLIATMMDAETLVILSNIDGIFDGNPADPSAKVIANINTAGLKDVADYIQTGQSSFGRGGMRTKYNIARKVAEEGIPVIIANGKRDNILLDIFNNPDAVCTRFVANPKPTSKVKKWIAHSEGFAKGEIYINEGAKTALLGEKASSLLAVGVVRTVGDFEKDDIVKILDASGECIGVGRVGCDSREVQAKIGKKGDKPVIHYDYLYINE
ncbi:MAG: glutamate 5-kinase [Candidatus Symbiothrix sp.]|jgi:glutamate 5-kinase|nr:glutamate 5-kinase [Candidatus Symbiothrix sp.]